MGEFFFGAGLAVLYYVICASSALLIRFVTRIPDEPFRKLLHLILLNSLPVFLFGFKVWWHSALFCIIFEVVVYPVLMFFEHFKAYSKTVTERRSGELKSSLLVVFTMFAFVISVCWGLLDDRMLALAVIYAWGIGDAAAAIIGKHFGKHKIHGGKKSYEGSLSMFLCAVASVFVFLMLRGGLAWYECLITASLTGAVTVLVELYTPGGFDTVTCPIAALSVMLPLVYFVF